MMHRVQRSLVLVLFAAIVLVAAGAVIQSLKSRPPSADWYSLIDGVQSRQSFAEVQLSAAFSNLEWDVVEQTHHPKGGERPRFEVLSVCARGYRSLGVSGELCLSFYNDKLSSTTFYPGDPVAYNTRLQRVQPAPDTPHSVKVRTGKDPRGLPFFTWADPDVEREQAEWIRRYS